MSDITPNKDRHRSEFLQIRSLLGMSRQEQADFCWADMKRFFKVTLWDRGHTCAYEKCPYPDKLINSFDEATLDHIVPRSKGGRTRLANLQLMHARCNSKRSSKIIPVSRRQYLKALTPPKSNSGGVTKYMLKRGLA